MSSKEDLEEEQADLNFARNQLAAALNATSIIQVVNRAATKTQASVLLRITDGEQGEEKWLQLVRFLLMQEREADKKWSLFIAQQYFLDDQADLRFGWHMSLTSRNIVWAIGQMKKFIEIAATQLGIQFRLESIPLPHVKGAGRNQVDPVTGRGVAGTTDGYVPAILRRGR